MKTRLHIIGLRYYSWCARMAEIFAPDAPQDGTWMGQKLFLQRDHQCAADPHAVMAWTLTDPVGHVSKVDLPRIAGVMEQEKRDLVVVRIVALDARRRALVVEPVDELPELPGQTPEPVAWSWAGPVLPLPAVWAQADHFGRMMTLLAAGELTWNDEVEEMVRRYKQYTVTDLSGEAYARRARLAQTLLQSSDPRLSETGYDLLAVMDHMGSAEQMTAWYTLMSTTLHGSPEVRAMASRYADADMLQVLAALRSFPLEIGREWLAGNTDRFTRRLYYAQLPRTEILKLLSLIVLYTSACRRGQPASMQPAIGLNLGGVGQLSVGTLDNHGTVMSVEQAKIISQPLIHKDL